MPVLTDPRHELFAQARAAGKSASDAYQDAGYRPHRGNAARMSANEGISRRVAEIQSAAAESVAVTVASITEGLLRIAGKGEAMGDAAGLAVARGSLMDAAKINGLLIDRSEVQSVTYTISGDMPSPDEWEAEHVTPH